MHRFLDYIERTLHHQYDAEERKWLGRTLMQGLTDLTRTQTFTDKDRIFPKDISERLQNAVDRLHKGEPIQYILGSTEFGGLTFRVRPGVLIPRPETEELAEWIIKDAQTRFTSSEFHLLDIGTGSGCLATLLAYRLPQSRVEAWDISSEALTVAAENASLNGVNVDYTLRDVLTYKPAIENIAAFDVIVSNPPYVCISEKSQMTDRVLFYEPSIALFVDDEDPLIFYRVISQLAIQLLKPSGCLYLEINGFLGKETLALLQSFSFSSLELRQDMAGKDRMIKAIR